MIHPSNSLPIIENRNFCSHENMGEHFCTPKPDFIRIGTWIRRVNFEPTATLYSKTNFRPCQIAIIYLIILYFYTAEWNRYCKLLVYVYQGEVDVCHGNWLQFLHSKTPFPPALFINLNFVSLGVSCDLISLLLKLISLATRTHCTA